MTAFETRRRGSLGTTANHDLFHLVNTPLAVLKRWNDARVTRKALSSLSDRELDDIGLCRGDIDRIG
jgi:uncharacterized protein YjiS (DUF1127 family)